MSKKTEELNVVASEPLESIDDSKKDDSKDGTTDDKLKDSTTDSTDASATTTEKVSDKKEDNDKEIKSKKELDDEKNKNDEKPLPEIKSEESSSEAKKERKTVSFKSEVDATEEVPINDDQEEKAPPPPPPRPKDSVQRVIDELKAAFPNIEEKLITATLIASQGNPDPAFNALLYISDPSFKPEIPVYNPAPETSVLAKKPTNELTDDELLARKLQKEFELEDRRNRRRSHERRKEQQQRHHHQQQQALNEDFEDSPDEFEQIKETFTQGLEDARTTLNGWVSNLARKFDGNQQDQQGHQGQQQGSGNQNPKLFGALGGSSFNENKRKSNRFDEDPEIISNDFHDRIRLQDNDTEETPTLPTRPKNETTNVPETDTKKQWQPLETENANSDAFLVTDSEDEDIIGTATTSSNKKYI